MFLEMRLTGARKFAMPGKHVQRPDVSRRPNGRKFPRGDVGGIVLCLALSPLALADTKLSGDVGPSWRPKPRTVMVIDGGKTAHAG